MRRKRDKQKKRRIVGSNIVLILMIVAGLGLILYPSVANWWNSKHQTRLISDYTSAVQSTDTEKEEQMLASAQAYNAKLKERGFSLILNDEEKAEYEAQLDVTGTGIMAYIEIPKIATTLPIYHGTDEAALQIAIGHLEGTSLPVGGESTHSVVSGHRGLPSAQLFTRLDELVIGDRFMIHVLNETLTYEVDNIQIVLPDEVSSLAIQEGKDLVTLVTCTPYGVNSHRLLVTGHRVENDAVSPVISANATQVPTKTVALVLTVIFAVIILIVWLVMRRHQPTYDDL
ncbi:MAG: class C sortase [Galactobacillus timonensis]|uniref:class C sortase n=1 Tax=Galactobacillus timonensis TaxID=2041840 RepID=UPI00240A976D|nr:class C sortase [Galactobacillus timonensis]MDD6600009.1 class C sortase [Galactobacillus timonensis]